MVCPRSAIRYAIISSLAVEKIITCFSIFVDEDYEYYRRELMEGYPVHLTQPRRGGHSLLLSLIRTKRPYFVHQFDKRYVVLVSDLYDLPFGIKEIPLCIY